MLLIESAKLDELSTDEISLVYEIMRNAYAVTEVEIWGENYIRISKEDFLDLFSKNEIFIARLNDEIVGCIHVYKVSNDTFSFGLLAVDFNKKGEGIGRALITAAEKHAKENGAKHMEIEILRASDILVPIKQVLHDWYQRLGYVFINSVSFLERKPDKIEKSKMLIVPAVFDCYRKELSEVAV